MTIFFSISLLHIRWDQARSPMPSCGPLLHACPDPHSQSDMRLSGCAWRCTIALLSQRCSRCTQQAGAWGPDKEKPKASKELMQIRFSQVRSCAASSCRRATVERAPQVDASQLRDFIQKWPRGTSKDGQQTSCPCSPAVSMAAQVLDSPSSCSLWRSKLRMAT